MQGSDANRMSKYGLRAAVAALLLAAGSTAGFAQSEPPLGVPLAGALPGPSSGCEPGVANGQSLYTPTGQATAQTSGTNKTSSGNNFGTPTDYTVPLYSTPNAGGNIPLYSNPLDGDNVPLYGAPVAGQNAPLYTTPTLQNPNGTLQSGYTPAANIGPTSCRSGIPVRESLIYPPLNTYSMYSNPLFLSPTQRLNVWSVGETPTVTAQWTNGIHSTTLFANADMQQYPTENPINTFDRQANWTQKYSPTPDLTFTGLIDYTHKTVANALNSSIPQAITSPVTTPTTLPNGDTLLPNGNIVNSSGQVVGNINNGSAGGAQVLVNPYDQYTSSFSASKIFNRAILTLSGAWGQTDYEKLQGTGAGAYTSFATQTYNSSGALWLTPILYAFSDGVVAMHRTAEGIDPYSQSFRARGGFGTTQFGGFSGNVYYGYQQSNSDTGKADGLVYGGRINYYPSVLWTLTASLDETINKATGEPRI